MFNKVRDGKKVAPTCPECGCRLQITEVSLRHFIHASRLTDARGCKCKLLNNHWFKYDGKISTLHMTNVKSY